MPDLRGTGETRGRISFGWNERLDLLACYDYLKDRGFTDIAVHGVSLGAATICYSLQEQTDYSFIVFESPYDNLRNALRHRLRRFHIPERPIFPMRVFAEKMLRMKEADLRPEEFIKLVQCPVLYLAGDSEYQVPIEETYKIFSNCGSKDKKLHVFHGGKHEDLLVRFREEYREVWQIFVIEQMKASVEDLAIL